MNIVRSPLLASSFLLKVQRFGELHDTTPRGC